MNRKFNNKSVVAALALSGALLLGACGSKDDDTASRPDGNGAPTSQASQNDGNSADAKKFAAEAKERGEPELSATEVPTELVIKDDVEGTGKEVKAGDSVTVEYKGAAASTGQVFDSSWSRGEPASFPLDGVIEGWSKGLLGMKEGGRRTLVIPAELAYGNGGPAPGDALVFVVDLISVDNG